MKKIFYLTLFLTLLFSNYSIGQFYKDVKGVKKYEAKMDKIDSYLKLDPFSAYQLIDDLEQLSDKEDNNELKVVCDIFRGTYYYYISQNDSSLIFFERAIHFADSIESPQLKSAASIRQLFVIDEGVESSLMFDLMKEEYSIALENRDTINMISSLNGLGAYAADLDSTERSFHYYLRAIELAKESKNEFERGSLLNNLALLKLRLDSPEEALKDLKEGLEIAQKIKNLRLELFFIDNFGYYYSVVDSVELAKKQYDYALKVAKEKNFPLIELLAMINLSSLESRLGNEKKSDSLIVFSLEIAKNKGIKHFISYIYLEQVNHLIDEGKYNNANQLLDSVVAYSKYGPRGDIMLNYYSLKSELFKKKGDYKTAMDYYGRMNDLSDSLDKKTHMQIMTQIQLKYDVEKKEIQRVKEKLSFENKLRQKEENEAKIRQWFIVVIFSFLLIISLVLVLYFRSKNKQEAKFSTAIINQLETERERIAKDLHDGIGQNLIIIKNKFNNLKLEESLALDELNENLSSTLEDVRSISRSLIPPELKRLGLHKSIDKMLSEVAKSTGMLVTSDLELLDQMKLEKSHEIRIYRIIQELLTNTIKHSKATSLKVEFLKSNSGYSIVYQDNGVGINEELIQESNSIGLRSIRSRLKMLNGTIKFEKQETGLKAVIRIKNK